MLQRPNDLRHLVMAEDDEDDCLLAREAFAEARLANPLDVVGDGVELMAYLNRHGPWQQLAGTALPCLILLDLNMPRKNGFEVLEELRATPHLRTLPVVALTTSRQERDVLAMYRLGVNSYISKPVRFEGLVQVMQVLQHYWFGIVELPGPVADFGPPPKGTQRSENRS